MSLLKKKREGKIMYELLKTDGLAKRGRLHTVHGVIETPVFMNVGTIAAIKGAVSTTDLQEIGTQVELSNTYHLHVRPGDEVVKKLGGLHKFMVWDKPILTDSGGFQVFSLAGLRRIKEEGLGVFNGDCGSIVDINDNDEYILVLFDDGKWVQYDYIQLDELELSYAVTIHKSQGSEYPVVIIPLISGPPMLLSRNLLYTAVTRAKKLAVIVGIPETMYKMVDNVREIQRYSSLEKRLRNLNEFMFGI